MAPHVATRDKRSDRDILLSMEEMQKMGKTSGRMEERLNAIQSRSSNQSHRFRAVKESYKTLGLDLENRLKKMMEKNGVMTLMKPRIIW